MMFVLLLFSWAQCLSACLLVGCIKQPAHHPHVHILGVSLAPLFSQDGRAASRMHMMHMLCAVMQQSLESFKNKWSKITICQTTRTTTTTTKYVLLQHHPHTQRLCRHMYTSRIGVTTGFLGWHGITQEALGRRSCNLVLLLFSIGSA